jgi:hypothetical protein
MPILGIIASSFRSAAGPVGAYDSLATVTVPSGGVASVTFAGIPSGYKHLQIRCFAQTNRGTYAIDEMKGNFNGITTSSYTAHYLTGDGSAAGSSADTLPNTYMRLGVGNIGTSTGSNWGAVVLDILDYADTNKNKTVRGLGGTDCNGTVAGLGGKIVLNSGAFLSTNAITSITLAPLQSSLFNQYSSFALYGVK